MSLRAIQLEEHRVQPDSCFSLKDGVRTLQAVFVSSYRYGGTLFRRQLTAVL